MHTRQLRKALRHQDVRDLVQAERYAWRLRKPLNTTITIHPKALDAYPADLGIWVSAILNMLRIWCVRRFGYFCVWVRENFEGERREHLHILIHVPESERLLLGSALRRWLCGDDTVVRLTPAEWNPDSRGRLVNQALTYLLKQMSPQAAYGLRYHFPGCYIRRQTACSDRGLPVAAVLGKRCGVSRTLSKTTRRAA